MKRFIKDGKEFIEWELKDVEICLALMDGSARPSDFDMPFTTAALLLVWYADELVKKSSADFASAINRARALAKSFSEAADLSGEWDEDNRMDT
jgi:hypothetical protein